MIVASKQASLLESQALELAVGALHTFSGDVKVVTAVCRLVDVLAEAGEWGGWEGVKREGGRERVGGWERLRGGESDCGR